MRIRARLHRARARARGWAAAESDLRRLEEQVGRLSKQLSSQRRAIRSLRKVGAARAQRLRELHAEFRRMGHQLASLEARVADAAEATAPLAQPAEFSDDPVAMEVRAVLDEIRREHERIRVRFRTITAYEERMRRIEESVFAPDETDMSDGRPSASGFAGL